MYLKEKLGLPSPRALTLQDRRKKGTEIEHTVSAIFMLFQISAINSANVDAGKYRSTKYIYTDLHHHPYFDWVIVV